LLFRLRAITAIPAMTAILGHPYPLGLI